MCQNSDCLGYILLIVLLGFAVLIYFLLRHRKNFLSENLQISPDKIWEMISQRATQNRLSKEDFIYGVYQDKTASILQILVKDSKGVVIASIENPMGQRRLDISVGNEKFEVEYPLTWRKSAILKSNQGMLLSKFEKLPFSYRKHQFIIPNLGSLISQNSKLSTHFPFDYYLNGKAIGITQGISRRAVGSIAAFPSHVPLSIKVFILAIHATGI